MTQKSEVTKWRNRTFWEKGITVFACVISIAIIILAIMQMTGIWKNAINIFEPLLGVLMLINAINIYKHNKLTALFNLGVAIFIFIVAFIVNFVR